MTSVWLSVMVSVFFLKIVVRSSIISTKTGAAFVAHVVVMIYKESFGWYIRLTNTFQFML